MILWRSTLRRCSHRSTQHRASTRMIPESMSLKFLTILISLTLLSSMAQAPNLSKDPTQSQSPVQILIEGDMPTIRLLKDELRVWSFKMRKTIVYTDKVSFPHDLRIIVSADWATESPSCSASCNNVGTCTDASASTTCSTSVTLHFVSAVGIIADGNYQFTETGTGSTPRRAVEPLARRVAKWLSVLPKVPPTPSK
jgi:hypothetical protein